VSDGKEKVVKKRNMNDEENEKVVSDGKEKEEEVASGNYKEELLATLTDPGWKEALKGEFEKEYFNKLCDFLEGEKKSGKEVFPPQELIFSALNLTPFDQVKAVILGQDPYHDNGQAHGLCFSVQKGITTPPSLKNIYKELQNDIPGFKAPSHGFLEAWAKQGVLLLNATLTVEAHKANSHSNSGWQIFTNAVINALNDKKDGLVFLLWGTFAKKKGAGINKIKHRIIEAAHPSPLSVKSWFGCKVFSKTNIALKVLHKEPIDWSLPAQI